MKIFVPLEVSIENGNPSLDDVRLWVSEIINYGCLNSRNDLKYIPIKEATVIIGEPKEIHGEE